MNVGDDDVKNSFIVYESLEWLNQVIAFVKERFGQDLQCLLLYDKDRRPFLSVKITSGFDSLSRTKNYGRVWNNED